MKLKSERQYLVDVSECPRCGSDHERLLFTGLANPEGRDNLWTLCPKTNQPVLIATEDID
jgi:hypothetical protein